MITIVTRVIGKRSIITLVLNHPCPEKALEKFSEYTPKIIKAIAIKHLLDFTPGPML